ncbi:endonuclease 8-like 3 isoform X1 [Mya arenaria]|uniref:endonuclease 8-like 3 isoform X1 n=2 Tax=Mya arenaria TaxID=6604 RepID=UPI0022E07D95|nr:endonuclease 8-like 3 isoform X1 [Mya arenaria]
MVEGPGCKLKGIKIKDKIKGQCVKRVGGNAVDKFKKKDVGAASPFHQLIGRHLEDVQTLGKELFMYFGDICLRVHFLMDGQSFINNAKVNNDSGGRTETATLELHMSEDVLTFKKSSVDIRPSVPCRQKYETMNDVDICSPVFNFRRAFSLVREQTDRQVCDVLLDQSILPGVGNIIKNEALFDSGIKPSSKIGELKDEHIRHLLKMTRDFTDIFYRCRRDGKQLSPYYKIYGKRLCKQCEGRVIICRLGDDSGRVTYFCENCQTNDLVNKNRKLPSKNSLLGWVQTGSHISQPEMADWSCEHCTLINKDTATSCSACLNPRVDKTVEAKPAQFGAKGHVSGQGNQTMNRKRKTEDSGVEQTRAKTQKINTSVVKLENKTGFKTKIPQNGSAKTNKTQNGTTKEQSDKSRIPMCEHHKRKCSMKEVRKEGQNLGRWFFLCVVRSCNFFQWADVNFPTCTDHGKPCTIRTVLKIGPNNGKRFFTCKLPKKKQCKFFEWAIGYD